MRTPSPRSKRMGRRHRVGASLAVLALGAVGATQQLASAETTTGSPGQETRAEAPTYHAAQGPLLADAQIAGIAHSAASVAGEPSPSGVRAVDTSLEHAVEINPNNVMPPAPLPSMAAL